MSHLIADRTPRVQGVGDIVSDIQGLYAVLRGGESEGGFSGYMSDLYRKFSEVPDQVRAMQGQVQRVMAVFTAAKADTAPLLDAQRDLAHLTALLPAAQRKVSELMSALGPILPSINAGNITSDTIAVLASHGIDVVETYNSVHDIFALRDDAQMKIQQAVTDPSLSPALAQQAAQAMAFSGPSLGVSLLLIGVFGAMLFGLARRRS